MNHTIAAFMYTASDNMSGALIVGLFISAAQLFWGYRLKKLWITLQGILVGFIVSGVVAGVANAGGNNSFLAIAGSIMCAVLGGWVAYRFYKIGVFMACFSCTFIVAILLTNIVFHFDSLGTSAVLSFLVGVAVGILGVLLTKPVFIITTSVSGGAGCGMAAGALVGEAWVSILLSIIMITVGIWYQTKSNGGLFEKKSTEKDTGEAA